MKTSVETNQFINRTMEEHPSLHFIAYTSESPVCVLAVSPKTRKAHFFYEVNEDMGFHFNLLSECAPTFHEVFTKMITNTNFVLGAMETDTDYFNILTPPPVYSISLVS